MKKSYVFISYSTKESDIATLVHGYLEGNGVGCWIASRDIEGGDSFAEQIVLAIRSCSAFVMIASPNSDTSPHVSNELSLALGAHKKIIPFRLQDYNVSTANEYYLQQAQWINAYGDMNEALKHLLKAVRTTIPADTVEKNISATPENTPMFVKKAEENSAEELDDIPSLTREEIVNTLLGKIDKYPYCLRDRTYGEMYASFKGKARILFKHTLTMYYRGRPTAGGVDYVDIIVDTLSQGQGVSIQVKGLPGSAKNMLVQLAYYKMLENFKNGESDHLPIYLSSSYYEKRSYTKGNEREEMTSLIAEELSEYFRYLRKNPNVSPVLMLEAVREHKISSFAPEDVILELWQSYGKFNRIVAIDVGLIKNKLRHKRTIPLLGDASGYSFRFRSMPITNKADCYEMIRSVLDMYIEKYEGLEAADVYNALFKMRFSIIDIFSVRLVATELSQGHSVEDISLSDMYERLALNSLKGGESEMLSIAQGLYEYVCCERQKITEYNPVLWRLPHMHNTFLEFLIAYYFSYCIEHAEESGDFEFLRITMTSMENHFMVSRLQENYPLQDMLVKLVKNNYSMLDIIQKSNAAYWLGKLTYADLSEKAIPMLEAEYKRLLPMVKRDNRQTLDNRHNHNLFRSVCNALISHGRTNILDEYLCLIVINDVANAINRGTVIQYIGDSAYISAHNDYYLDTNFNIGEQAIRILCSLVEARLSAKRSGYVETDLVSLLTLVQARMHTVPEKLPYNLMPYCEKCLELLEEYQTRPRSIVSDKLLFYFQSVADDMKNYIEKSRFDVAFSLYTDLSRMKDTKRYQWLEYGIEDPESVAEHTMNTWTMAMIYLPAECSEQNYNKSEILEMILLHDMAEAILGDNKSVGLSEPTKELRLQNQLLRKLFLKGTYPEVANMTQYYNIWTGYYNGQNINARIARDMNLIQTVNTFFDYFIKNPERFSLETVNKWRSKSDKLSTDIGFALYERIILHNPLYRKAIDKLITDSARKEL